MAPPGPEGDAAGRAAAARPGGSVGGPVAGVIARAGAAAQVFVEDPAAPELSAEDAHHLSRVLRLRAGETVVAADGRGRWASCRYRGGRPGDPAGALLEPDGPVQADPPPAPVLTVAFAPAKGDRPEWVVQKLTELGVDRILPVRCARSVVRWEDGRAERAVARLRRVAREAAAQCRRTWLPEVAPLQELGQLLGGDPGALSPARMAPARMAPARMAPARMAPARMALAQLGGAAPGPGTVSLAVGPEGGWAAEELAAAGSLVGLGPQVLRSETAAVAAGSIMAALRAGTVEAAAGPAAAGNERTEMGESQGCPTGSSG